MKKVIVVLMILIAPIAAYSSFNAGVAIGYNATTLTSDWDDINGNLKSGFQFGIFARLGDKFFLQPELLYASRGGYQEFQDEATGAVLSRTEGHTGMFQIPVMLGLKLIDGDMLGVNVQAGPVMSIITDKGMTDVGNAFANKSFEDFTWGVQLGAGIDFMSFILNIRYEYPLSDIYKVPNDTQNFSAKAHTFLVTLGWKLL